LLIEGATVVTMDARHTVVPDGRVLVRAGRIVAVWSGPVPPDGVVVGHPSVIEASSHDLVFPGLINLHDHPDFDFVAAWAPPSSDAIPTEGKAGTDPYANRYQWGAVGSETVSPEEKRLIGYPASLLTDGFSGDGFGLGLSGEIVKYAEVAALLGGETAVQGAHKNAAADHILVRNIDNNAFDTRVAKPRVGPIATFDPTSLLADMKAGKVDAWMVHLAEGVRDGDRRPGDPDSSRREFLELKAKGLLTDMTVIIHGTALERSDFAELRAAPRIGDEIGDGRGAKLVWSPLSNLLLYGKTTNVYEALAEGVLVSLGTDWTPSGSRTLLHELKVADVALRDDRVLGQSRDEVPALALTGKTERQRQRAEAALDRVLVDMVTRNPALTLRWYDRVGSVEAGKFADLLVIHRPGQPPPAGLPDSVYRDLIDAHEQDVELVLVGGEPLAGDPSLVAALKPGDYELVTSAAARFSKAVDVTKPGVVDGTETLGSITLALEDAVDALGGDEPPPGGGPGPANNTYHYLKVHVDGGAYAGLRDSTFHQMLADRVGAFRDGSLNLERIQLDPLLEADDDFLAHLLHGELDGSGLIADATPPYRLYHANLNQIGPLGNPFAGVS